MRVRPSACYHKLLHRNFSSTARRPYLQLAYDLHAPNKQKDNTRPDGNAIVFIHGLFGSKKNNRSMSKVLARDLNRPVFAIDLRNHGDSPHDPIHDYTALAEDVEHFLDEHALQDPTLIGHSMGAKTAMTVALKSPTRIANLVSIDNAPIDAALKSDFGNYIKGMQKVEAAHVSKQAEADAILAQVEESLPIRQFLLTNLLRPTAEKPYMHFRLPLRTLATSLDHMADFPFTDPDTTRFERPTLFVRGTQSHYVADDTLPLIGRFFPRFELVDIDSGHWVVSEKPEDFRRAIVDFLGDKV